MPIFSYKCKKCGQTSDLLIKTSSNHNLKCPNCNSTELERVYSPLLVLKNANGVSGHTCCGKTERCDVPPCSSDDTCWRN